MEPIALWKKQAVAAHRRRVDEAAAAADAVLGANDADDAAELAQWLEQLKVPGVPERGSLVLDGVTFLLTAERQVIILRTCARCGENIVPSPPLLDQADVGFALDTWVPECPDCESGLTLAGDTLSQHEQVLSEAFLAYAKALMLRHLPLAS